MVTSVLSQLIFDSEFRSRFFANPAPDSDFVSVDQKQLQAFCSRLKHNVLQGSGEKSFGLAAQFALSLSVLSEVDPKLTADFLMDRFISSEIFSEYSDVPYVPSRYSLEEAFYKFLVLTLNPVEKILEEIIRRDALTSLYRRLATSRDTNFLIPENWAAKTPTGYHTIQSFDYDLATQTLRPHRFLFESRPMTFLSGEI